MVINRAYSMAQFWDGRAKSLEEHAEGPIAYPVEMGMTHDGVVTRIQGVKGYRPMFHAAFVTEGVRMPISAWGPDKPDPDVGRYAVTHDARDWACSRRRPCARSITRPRTCTMAV